MQTRKLFPLFTTDNVAGSRDFYTRHLGFRVHFEMDEYVALRCGDGVELGFMKPTSSECVLGRGAGLYYCLEVDDVDVEHERLVRAGVAIQEEPSDKPWGDRAMTLADPNGITVYLFHAIQPAVEYASSFK
jgi:catechol 2,3-dioxygenase-like lactoylglutathione lyase family enzyme